MFGKAIYSKNPPKQTCGYWWITPNQKKTLCIETNIFKKRTITNQRESNYKSADSYKITPLTVQCRLQSMVWLGLELPVLRQLAGSMLLT